MKSALWILSLATLLAVPFAGAQVSEDARIHISVQRVDEGARIQPGASETMWVSVSVFLPSLAYCMEPLHMVVGVDSVPLYAGVSVSPASQPLARQQPSYTSHSNALAAHFELNVTVTEDAPALEAGRYRLLARLVAPEGVTCNVRSSEATLEFGLVNEYKPDTRVRALEWNPDESEYFGIEVVNGANGRTRIRAEPVLFDPMALGRFQAPKLTLEPGQTAFLRARFTDVTPGYHSAKIGIHSTFAGADQPFTDFDEVFIETAGRPRTTAQSEGGTAPAAPSLGLLAVFLVLALVRRRVQGSG